MLDRRHAQAVTFEVSALAFSALAAALPEVAIFLATAALATPIGALALAVLTEIGVDVSTSLARAHQLRVTAAG